MYSTLSEIASTSNSNILDIVNDTLNDSATSSHKLQKLFTSLLQENQYNDVLQKFRNTRTLPDNARIRSCYGPHSGAWLLCVPKDSHSMMENEAFQFACSLRLGLPIHGSSTYCSLCKVHIDNIGIHAFSCPKQRSRLLEKHDKFCRDLKLLAQLAGIQAKDHHLTVFTCLDPENRLRPDLYFPTLGKLGRILLIDVVFTDPRNISNVVLAAIKIGAARNKKELMKEKKYQELSNELGYSFLGAALEIFGSMTKRLDSLISNLVQKAANRAQIPFEILLPYWRKRLSMNVQQGNAKFWMDSTVRMSGNDSLRDVSLNLNTHHIRTVAE